jgi:hypothetical protein
LFFIHSLQSRVHKLGVKTLKWATVRIQIRDPGSSAFLTPWSGIRDGQKVRIRDEQPGSYFRELKKQFFGSKYLNSLMRIRDPGWKKFGSGMEKIRIQDGKNSDLVSGMEKFGSGINNPDPQHWWAENVRGREKGNHKTNQLRIQQTKINSKKNQAASSKPSGEAAWEAGAAPLPLLPAAATAPEASIEAARPRRSAGRRPSPPPPPITSLLLFRISLLSRMSGVRDGKW